MTVSGQDLAGSAKAFGASSYPLTINTFTNTHYT